MIMGASITPVGSTFILSSVASAHTLQAFIELVYVKTANDVMVSQMASLEQALATTKSATDTLTQIQNLHNLVSVVSKSLPSGALSAGIGVTGYSKIASDIFGKPIQISFSFSSLSGGLNGFLIQRSAIISQLESQISALQKTTPTISGREDSNSLLAKLSAVLNDIKPPTTVVINGKTYSAHSIPSAGLFSNFSTAFKLAGVEKWLTDGYNSSTGSTSSGIIQQNITNAVTAAQSLNTTQTESVRNFLYIYEEYYKSASAVLQAITQIISKMAGNIAR
jgi:hypothetical protein